MYKTLKSPLTVQLELTNICDNNCFHCYNFWRKDFASQLARGLSSNQVKFILEKLAEAEVFDVIITGGEPLLNKKGLFSCLEQVSRLGMGISLNSNLRSLNRDYARRLYKLGLRNVLTSVMGPTAAIHDAITQRSDSFEQTTHNIQLCLELGFHVVVNMVVSRFNFDQVKETARLVCSLGVRKFCATKAGCPGNCYDFSGLSLTFNEFRSYLRDLHEVGEELDLDIDVLESYPLCGIKDVDLYPEFINRRCLAGVTSCTIASDGKVRPCSHLDINYGDIFSEDIATIWSRMENWRQGNFLPATCKSCPLLLHCGGGCRMEAKMRRGALDALDPYASPADVPYCEKRIKMSHSIGKEQSPEIKSFRVNRYRYRKEFFGSIVMVGKMSRVYLDQTGTKVIDQFRPGQTYTVDNIDWNGLDPQDFLLELAKKEMICLDINRR